MGAKRATVYFEPAVHKALRLKAAASERTISDVVNESVRLALSEDAEDLEAFDERRKEKAIPFEAVVRDLKRRGLL
ncbi:MAG: CopG family transcriptional regulator [Acidobacteria bacterium]|nr:CopG family transcriptional regulator [Acidobacteriota bacterium]